MPRPVRAPELEGRGGWIGVDQPLSLAALRGKVVVVFFFRFSCVSCLRVVEELRPLQRQYSEELVVVGVHCPRWPHETDHASVVSAVARHRVDHPVVDDPDLATASLYGVQALPTVVVVDPAGVVVDSFPGQGVKTPLEESVAGVVTEHESNGRLRPGPLPLRREVLAVPLAYPSKVAVSADGRRLAISDTSYDQVVECTVDGVVLAVHTGFSHPHGVRFDDSEGGGVVVCDTGAGRVVRSNGEVLADALASPWDLVGDVGGSWVVAEAGHHRLLRIRPDELRARVAAGTGAEGVADGLAAKAEMAQPSGVARTAGGIVFVDTEAGALRLLGDDQRVTTLVADGLEHPLGVAGDGGDRIYIADTYNSLLKVWEGGRLRALPVEGLDEPGGLDVLPDGRLVVADTNNHRVVIVDPAIGTVSPLELDDTWVHATEGDPVRVSSGAGFAVPWVVELVGEELEGARRTPVTVTVRSSPSYLLSSGTSTVAVRDHSGAVEVKAGQRGAGLLLVEVAADVRQGRRRRLRRVQRYRHEFEVR